MRLQILSDIHVDLCRDHGKTLIDTMKPEGIDILILAGDIFNLAKTKNATQTLNLIFNKGYKKVLFTPGNHEHWNGHGLTKGHEIALNLENTFPNFHYLYTGKILIIDGKRFLGDTMWFEKIKDDFNRRALQYSFPDFSLIPKADPECYEEFEKFKEFLGTNLQEGDIVVTHHLPSPHSTAERFKEDPIGCFFNVNLDELILARKPALWVHGHTHDFFNYRIGDTRIVCNPQDYPFLVPPPAKHFVVDI